MFCKYPGVEGGLRLLLNVEQYEYTRGVNAEAGAKVVGFSLLGIRLVICI